MSILIKGMEMPTIENGTMIFAIRPDGMVEDVMGCYVGKAVPVPEHGRCVDESALLAGCGYIIADGMACIPVKYIAKAAEEFQVKLRALFKKYDL